MHRKTIRSETIEVRLLSILVVISLFFIPTCMLELTSEPYGSRSSGTDIATTIINTIAATMNWTFLIVTPTVSVSGLSSSMFSFIGSGKIIYSRLVPFMLLGTTVSSILPLMILFSIGENSQIVSAIYVSLALPCPNSLSIYSYVPNLTKSDQMM
jgi:hypothetical protein